MADFTLPALAPAAPTTAQITNQSSGATTTSGIAAPKQTTPTFTVPPVQQAVPTTQTPTAPGAVPNVITTKPAVAQATKQTAAVNQVTQSVAQQQAIKAAADKTAADKLAADKLAQQGVDTTKNTSGLAEGAAAGSMKWDSNTNQWTPTAPPPGEDKVQEAQAAADAAKTDEEKSQASEDVKAAQNEKDELAYQAEAKQKTAESDARLQAEYDKHVKDTEAMINGTYPLTPEQQYQLESIKNRFEGLIATQKVANQNYENAIRMAGISAGRNMYAPEVELGNVSAAVTAGLKAVTDIEDKMTNALITARQAIQEGNLKALDNAYNDFYQLESAKRESIKTTYEQAKGALEEARAQQEARQKAVNDQVVNALKIEEMDDKRQNTVFNQVLSSEKFTFEQKQAAIKNAMDSDKMTYQQKQDAIENALSYGKFNYEQEKDLRNYQLDIKKMEQADTTTTYKDWVLAGRPGTYANFLQKAANKAPATADQEKRAGYAMRAKDSSDTITQLTKSYLDSGLLEQYGQKWKPNFLKTPDQRRMDQAQTDFVNAVLREESGAAIAVSEFTSAEREYFPQPGDDEATIKQREDSRRLKMMGLANGAGSALSEDFKKAVESGKVQYSNIQDFGQANPELREGIQQMIADKVPEDEILDFFQGNVEDDSSGFNSAESTALNSSKGLSALSSKYESNGDPGAIGYDNTGGWSYGKAQLAHSNAKTFIESSPYADAFQGLSFNSPEWRSRWKEVAKQDPEGFGKAQDDYIAQSYYEPQAKNLRSLGLDLDQRSDALKQVIYSTAVQHGANTDVVKQALKRVGPDASDGDLIKAIYEERWSGGKRFASSTTGVRNAVYNRFFGKNGEMRQALSSLA